MLSGSATAYLIPVVIIDLGESTFLVIFTQLEIQKVYNTGFMPSGETLVPRGAPRIMIMYCYAELVEAWSYPSTAQDDIHVRRNDKQNVFP